MNPSMLPCFRQAIIVVLLAALVLALTAPLAPAATTCVGASAIVPAFGMSDVVGSRSRMIQFSIGAVAFGIALLWWGNKTQ
jgi:uncharacterized membrane protein YgaE (UPF0421/DUF939 family)